MYEVYSQINYDMTQINDKVSFFKRVNGIMLSHFLVLRLSLRSKINTATAFSAAGSRHGF